MKNKQMRNILDIELVPGSGASKDIDGDIKCTGGSFECEGNRWLTCAVHEMNESDQARAEAIGCLERKEGAWFKRVKDCFKDDAKGFKKMKKCYEKSSKDLFSKVV